MPSPFPGMDPYLEDSGRWTGFHGRFINSAVELLNRSLDSNYYADNESMVYILEEDDPARRVIAPDIFAVSLASDAPPAAASGEGLYAGGVYTLTTAPLKIRQPRLVVVDKRGRKVVTALELLSPANKVVRSGIRAQYRRKRRDLLRSSTHLVEIDLLRGGKRMFDVGEIELDYLVHISRHGSRPKGWILPLLMQDPLPLIPIPLTGAKENAQLNLQEAFTLAYDRGPSSREIDYTEDPPKPRLNKKQRAWVKEILKSVRG